jgi:hypothetical protein
VATSLTDLFTAISALTDQHDHVTIAEADAAVLALAPAGQMLSWLADDGIGHARPRRAELVLGLATSCADAAAAWRGERVGRVSELMAASADVVGTLRTESGQAERWSCALQVAETVRRCATTARGHSPYGNVPELQRVYRAAAAIEQLGSLDPPPPADAKLLDRRIPVAGLPAGLGETAVAAEAAAWLLDHLRRPGTANLLTVRGAVAITYAAEIASTGIKALSAGLGDPDDTIELGDPSAIANEMPTAWREVRRAFAPFDDGTRAQREPLADVTLWAARLGETMRRTVQQGVASGEVRPPEVEGNVRSVAVHLPLLATEVLKNCVRWVAADQLLVDPSRVSPTRPDRIDAVLAHRLVLANAGDLGELVTSLKRVQVLGVVGIAGGAGAMNGIRGRPGLADQLDKSREQTRIWRDVSTTPAGGPEPPATAPSI